MILKKITKYIPAILSVVLFFNVSLTSTEAAPPLLPMVFSGDVSIKDGKSSDNQVIVAQILDNNNSVIFTSQSTIVKNNQYIALTVGPLDSVVIGKNVKFTFMCADTPCKQYAEQVIPFQSAKVNFRYTLVFDTAPPTKSELEAEAAKAKADEAAKQAALKAEAEAKAKAEAEAATKAKADEAAKQAALKAEAEAKAKAEAEAAAKAKADQDTQKPNTEPAIDLNAYPSIYSGTIVAAGTNIPKNAQLKAQIDDYITGPALIDGNNFQNLVISPADVKYIGKPIIFILNGIKSEPTKEIYESGKILDQLTLAFIGLPQENTQDTSQQIADSESPANTQLNDDSEGTGCSLVSANNNNYSSLLTFAMILLAPMVAYRRSKK